MRKFVSLLLLVLAVIITPLHAQTETAAVDSLNKRLYNKSNRYNESGVVYRVVKRDIINAYFQEIVALDEQKSAQIDESAKEIKSLEAERQVQQSSYDELNGKYEHAIKVNDAMEFFTLLIPKGQYNVLMWSLVFVLLAALLLLYLMFNRGHQATRLAKKELAEKIEEFESYRKRTLKREQEVATGYLRDIKRFKERLGES